MTKDEIIDDMMDAYKDVYDATFRIGSSIMDDNMPVAMGAALDVALAAILRDVVDLIDDQGQPNHTWINRDKTRAAVLALLEPAKQAEVA
jgi:hypothetical protein